MNPRPYDGLVARGVPRAAGYPMTRDRAMADLRVVARTWLALAVVLVAAAAVRLWAINSVGFNNDEAVYSGQGAALAADPIYSGLFAIFRAHPLLVHPVEEL